MVAVVGDGALTGGLAYEALNNLGHSGARVLIVLNDNGRSYAPTVSRLSVSLTQLRLDPRYLQVRERVRHLVEDLPGGVSSLAFTSFHGLSAAVREVVEPRMFFEALGIRYTGPIDGHDIGVLEQSLRRASSWHGPIVLHVVTTKGKGYAPAEADDIACLHDMKAVSPLPPAAARPGARGSAPGTQVSTSTDDGGLPGPLDAGESYAEVFSAALVELAASDERVVAITAAMPGPTGLLAFQDRYPDRFVDVGIAEQHAMTAAAGMAMNGLRPVVAIYSTFLPRCVDQWNLDVGLHHLPVVVCAGRAGITGDDGPSHHGIYDLVQALQIPGCAIFCPAETAELAPMLREAHKLEGPSLLRFPKTPSPGPIAAPGTGLKSRRLRTGTGEVVLVGIGKLTRAALAAADELADDGIESDVFDARVIRPADPELLEAMAHAAPRRHRRGRSGARRRRRVPGVRGRPPGGSGRSARATTGGARCAHEVPRARQAGRHPGASRPRRSRHRGRHAPGARKTSSRGSSPARRPARARRATQQRRARLATEPPRSEQLSVPAGLCVAALRARLPSVTGAFGDRLHELGTVLAGVVDERRHPEGDERIERGRPDQPFELARGQRLARQPQVEVLGRDEHRHAVVHRAHEVVGSRREHGAGSKRGRRRVAFRPPLFKKTAQKEQPRAWGPEAPGLLAARGAARCGGSPLVEGVGGQHAALALDCPPEHGL